jgi:MFS family permease
MSAAGLVSNSLRRGSSSSVSATPLHARDIALRRRVTAYLAMLSGYLFYCYNYIVLDYVRPYLIADYGLTLNATAKISVAQSVTVTLGALLAAPMVARFGRRKIMFLAAFAIGSMAVASALSRGFGGWLTARAIMAIFLATYYVVGINLTVALFPPQHRAKLSAVSSGMFSVAEMMLGGFGAAFGDRHWLWVVWLGAAPLLLCPLILLWVPEDAGFTAYGADPVHQTKSGGGWAEMLSSKWRRQTIACVLLSGLNLMGYQIFSGFVTLYLREVRHFGAADMGATVALIGTGSLIGGFFWAFTADRFGRKLNSIGFFGTALFISLFLIAPRNDRLLQLFGFFYGVCLSCAYCWGIWFTEIFPLRLRPYGAALFHGGHLISWGAPLITAWVAERSGLATAMSLGPTIFLAGGILWLTLPETLKCSPAYRGWDPETR